MKSALLFSFGGLGDLQAAFPSIYFLRKKIPSLSLILACRKEYGLLLKETGIVDQMVSVDEAKLRHLFSEPLLADHDLIPWLSNFNLILGWVQKEASRKLEKKFLSLGIGKCQFFVYEQNSRIPISRYFFEKTLQFFGHNPTLSPSFSECCYLPLTFKQKEDGLRLVGIKCSAAGEKFAVLHPGSGSVAKCWPLENFLEIMRRLARERFPGVLVTGDAEERMVKILRDSYFPLGWTWLHAPALLKLAGLLGSTSFYLGNDSGVTHLAAACGTKVVALFKKEYKAAWKPYGRVSLLSSTDLSRVSLDSVWKIISEYLRD